MLPWRLAAWLFPAFGCGGVISPADAALGTTTARRCRAPFLPKLGSQNLGCNSSGTACESVCCYLCSSGDKRDFKSDFGKNIVQMKKIASEFKPARGRTDVPQLPRCQWTVRVSLRGRRQEVALGAWLESASMPVPRGSRPAAGGSCPGPGSTVSRKEEPLSRMFHRVREGAFWNQARTRRAACCKVLPVV